MNVQFFATTPAPGQKILQALETQVPYLVVENITIRPLNAFRGFKPAPGQEPEINVQLDVSALAYPEAPRARRDARAARADEEVTMSTRATRRRCAAGSSGSCRSPRCCCSSCGRPTGAARSAASRRPSRRPRRSR